MTITATVYLESCVSDVNDWIAEGPPVEVVSRSSRVDLGLDMVLIRRLVSALDSTPYELHLVPIGSQELEGGTRVFLAERVRSMSVRWKNSTTIVVDCEAEFRLKDHIALIDRDDKMALLQIEYTDSSALKPPKDRKILRL